MEALATVANGALGHISSNSINTMKRESSIESFLAMMSASGDGPGIDPYRLSTSVPDDEDGTKEKVNSRNPSNQFDVNLKKRTPTNMEKDDISKKRKC